MIADDVQNMPETQTVIGRAVTQEQKAHLFRTAASKPYWEVAFCAAVIAVNTTCRKVELLNLRWSNVDLFEQVMSVERSKTEAGQRSIPLNREALAAFARLRKRAQSLGGGQSGDFVFPACENHVFDFSRPQKSFRSAWRGLIREAAKLAADRAEENAIKGAQDPAVARLLAAKPFVGFRFHDLRHQSITEMAEAGIPDAAMQSIAGHLSKKMLDHYSHVRMAAKRSAVESLGVGSLPTMATDQVNNRKPS